MRILMTGCSSGVGETIRHYLKATGHSVLGVGLDGPDIKWDFRDSVRSVWTAKLFVDHGPFDALILNAGMTYIEFIEDHPVQSFLDVLNVNLVAPFVFAREFVRSSPKDGQFRRIVCTSSMGALQGLTGSPGYCASKAGLEGMIRALSREFAGRKLPFGIYGVAPSTIEGTKMNEYVIERLMQIRGMEREQAVAYSNSMSPLKRSVTHTEVFSLVRRVVEGATEYESGNIFRMPGGAGI